MDGMIQPELDVHDGGKSKEAAEVDDLDQLELEVRVLEKSRNDAAEDSAVLGGVLYWTARVGPAHYPVVHDREAARSMNCNN